jgi:hypothetical protein
MNKPCPKIKKIIEKIIAYSITIAICVGVAFSFVKILDFLNLFVHKK